MTRARSRIPAPLRASISHRRGSLLFEMGVAAALLATVMAMLVPVMSRTFQKRLQIDQREQAQEAVACLLERASLIPELSPQTLQPIANQLLASSDLNTPSWDIKVTPEQSPPMNRVEATLSWQVRPQVRHTTTLIRWYAGGQP